MTRKIYLSGRAIGPYRVQTLMTYLMDSDIDFFYLNSDRVGALFSERKSMGWRIVRKLLQLVLFIAFLPLRLITIACSDTVYILPMCQGLRGTLFDQIVARLLGKRVISEIYYSVYDSEVYDRKVVTEGSLKAKWIKGYERFFISLLTDVVFLNRSEYEYYKQLLGLKLEQQQLHFHSLVALPRDKAELPYFHGKAETITIVWWGRFYPLHGLEKIIDAGAVLKRQGLDFKLVLFGNDAAKAKPYQEQIDHLGINDHVILRNDATFNNGKLTSFLQHHADLALGNFGDSGKARTVMCNKILDALGMGLPILTMPSAATVELLDKDRDVFICENSPQSIADAIVRLSGDREGACEAARLGRNTFLKQFTPAHYTNFVAELLNSARDV